MNESKEVFHFQDTLVAFFDVVGYSSFLESEEGNFSDTLAKINHLFGVIKHASETDFHSVKFHRWIMSDSFILVVDTQRHPLHRGSLNFLVATCSMILYEAMNICSLPLRGAIGGGYFYKSEDILLSTGLVDAAKFEKRQEWLGVMFTPTAIELMQKYDSNFLETYDKENSDFFSYGEIPLKKDIKEIGYYIKPFRPTDPNWIENLPSYFDKSRLFVSKSRVLYDV